jgi:hypothetical protein
MTTVRRSVAEIAKKATNAGLKRGYLAEEFDGVGSTIQVLMSRGSSSAVQAYIAVGSFGTEQTFPAGTPVYVLEYNGRLEVVSLGSKMSAGSITMPMVPPEGLPGEDPDPDNQDENGNQPPLITPGTLPGSVFTVGTIDSITPFADNIRPIVLVAANPTLPDTSYPVGSFIYNTVMNPPRLFKNVANVWTAPINAVDIQADTITAGEIHAGAIGATEIAAGAVSADKMSIGARIGGNRILNPGFEDAVSTILTAWTVDYEKVGSNTVICQDAGRKAGNWGGVIYAPTSSDGNSMASEGFPVQAGERLYLEASYNSTATITKGVFFRILFDSGTTQNFARGDADSYEHIVNDGPATTGVWNIARGYVTVPAGAMWARVALYNYMPNTGTYLVWDEIVCAALAGGVRNSDGNVTIDADGITITNGALHVQGLIGSHNLLRNGGFRGVPEAYMTHGVDYGHGWIFSHGSNPSVNAGLFDPSDTSWTLRDGDIDNRDSSVGPYGSTFRIFSSSSGTYYPYVRQTVPVTAGQVYSLQGLVANHRSTQVYLQIDWSKGDGTYLSSVTSNKLGPDIKTGGSWRDGWEVAKVEGAVAPALAALATILCVMMTPYTSGTDCYAFFDQVWFGVGAYAREFDQAEAYNVRNSDGNVIIDANGVTITGGKLTLTNSGSTVIIDGTSNMFKIAATGTQSNTFTDNATGTVDVTLTGLGTLSSSPAHQFYFSGGSGGTVLKSPNPSFRQGAFTDLWAAASSGGATTTRSIATYAWIEGATLLDGSSYCVVRMTGVLKGNGSSLAIYGRYYVMKEAAM